MVAWGDLFGSEGVIGQLLLWQVGGQVIGAVLTPALTAAQQEVWQAAIESGAGGVYVAASPADLADQVVRNIIDLQTAQGEAAKSGINPGDFQRMVDGAGEPPGLQTAIQMYLRGHIPWAGEGPGIASVANAIITGRLYNYWGPPIQATFDPNEPGGGDPLSPSQAVDAALRGQAPFTEMAAEALLSGVNNQRFQILVDSAGNPPSLTELIELVRRQIIPQSGTGPDVLSFQQGIFEGDNKDKWLEAYEQLQVYLPPPRTVTALERTGAIDAAQAQTYYQDFGLTPDLAAAYNKSILGEKMEGTKQFAQGVITELYEAQAIDEPTATEYLGILGYTPAQAAFILELYDLKRELAAVNKTINRVGTLYSTHKITRQSAVDFLNGLGVTGQHQANLLSTWDLALAAEVKLPTISELGAAVYYQAISADEAVARAQALGYTAWDAYVALSAAARGPVGAEPSPDSASNPGVI